MPVLHLIAEWFHQYENWPELLGVATGLLCVYLAAINNIWNWPFAIVNAVIYIYVFAQAGFYADMGQNIYLLVINIYGWYNWSKKPNLEAKLPIVRITKKQVGFLLFITAIVTPALGWLLIHSAPILHYKPAAYPYLDSFCTVISLTAQVFMARKILENWLIWIFVDIIYVGIYLSKGLHPTAALFGIYAILAFIGYFDWRKDYKLSNERR